MDTIATLNQWAALSADELAARLGAGADADALEALFGADEAAELQELAQGPAARGARPAAVLLPGIMGSLLASVRGVTALLWINPALFLKGQGNLLELDAAGQADGLPRVDTVPLALEKMTYAKAEVALSRQADLYEFPYDWRRPVQYNADLLAAYLQRWAADRPGQTFTLVGHSMGGLVSRACLARHPRLAETLVRRVVMLGTPHFGAANAVETLLEGNSMMALVSKLNSNNQMKRLLLNMPSAYQLLPAPPLLFPAVRPYPADWDLYDAAAWRTDGIRQDYLDAGRAFHELLAASDPQVPLVQIAGCNVETGVEVGRTFGPDGRPRLRVGKTAVGPDAGDGTVPLWSAVLPGATMYYVQEVHRALPRNKDVLNATLALLHGGEPDLDTELPRPRAVVAPRPAGEPEDEAAALRQRLEEGTASEEDLAGLYFAF